MRKVPVQLAVAIMLAVPTVAFGNFVDTFEPFTPGITVAGQGEWGALYGADHAIVRNDGTAYNGEQHLDFWQDSVSSTYPYRLGPIGTPLAGGNVASYYYRIGDRIGPTRNEAFSMFVWATGAGSTMVKTNTWEGGTLVYFLGPTAVNTGVSIAQDTWYLYEYTYDLASTCNWKVTRTTDSVVVLNVNFTTDVINQTTTYDLEFNKGTYAPGSSFHSLVDDVALTPEPATLALLSLGGLAVLVRRRRA